MAGARAGAISRPTGLGGLVRGIGAGLRALLGRLAGPLALLAPTELGDGTVKLNHYTNEDGRVGIRIDGIIGTSVDGNAYVTPDIYTSGAEAQARLALRNRPTGYWQVPRENIEAISHSGPVVGTDGQPVGGWEIAVPHPIRIDGASWIEIGP